MNIVVSGLGAVCGAGVGASALLDGWQKAGSNQVVAAAEEPPFNERQTVIRAGDFDAVARLGKKGLQFLTRGTHLLLAAADEAIRESLIKDQRENSTLGLVVGTNLAGLSAIANYDWTVISEGPSFVTAMDTPNVLANAPASHLAIRMKACGLNTTISTGRCASLDAIGYGAHFLEQKRADAVIAGGVEEVNAHVLWQYHAAYGGVKAIPGEGAAALVLRVNDESNGTSPRALANFSGWANSLAPASNPEDLVRDVCLEALELAQVRPDEVELIGIGVGSPADAPLLEGVRQAVAKTGSEARSFPCFSLKGLVGETLGAAGALHAVAAVEALHCRKVPASPGLNVNDWPEEFAVATEPRDFKPGPVLIVDWDPAGFASAVVLVPALAEAGR